MPIVVAVDGSAGSWAAIRLAAHEAECRQTGLLAVAAYRAGRAVVDTARSERAELIVLAARPGLAVIPGTVSQYVQRNAGRPVLIVPSGGPDPDGG